MEIKNIDINLIKPYWRNPREHNRFAIEELKKSIKKFGFNSPLVVDKNYVIIVGHARFQALKELGWKEIPCVIKDLPEDKAREYRIADNRISELSSWNFDFLKQEMRTIEECIGFSDEELRNILDEKSIEFEDYSKEEIDKEKEKLQDKFKEIVEEHKQKKIKLICPYCREEFEVSPIEIMREIEKLNK